MKVVIAYSRRPPIADYLKRAFEKMGVEAHVFHSDTNTLFDRCFIKHLNKMAHNLRIVPKSRTLFGDSPLAHLHYRGAKLLEKVSEIRPDLVLIIRGWRYTEEVLRQVREKAVLMGWWVEGEDRMKEPFREIDLFDHYCFLSSVFVEEGQRKGCRNMSLLRHSVCTSSFHPVGCEKKYDWCFVGGWSPKRMLYIEKALALSKNGVIYGPKWLKKNRFNIGLRRTVKGGYIGGEELAKLYSQSRVVLNITNWDLGDGRRSGMTMRVLEVPACGAFLLTDGSSDLDSVVTPGEHVAIYEGLGDFVKQLESYLKDKTERERIALRGYQHVISNYSYDKMAEEISRKYESVLISKAGKVCYGQPVME